jgi:hypothetical protein
MVSRSEIDMKRIKDAYRKDYGKTLYQEILVSLNEQNDVIAIGITALL